MITMENVLKRGRTVWDRALLPEDEYVDRVRAVREAMAAAEIDVLVTIGHTTHYGNFTYLSGSVPLLGWMSIVLGGEAGPLLVSGGGTRELIALRPQTWIEEIRTSRSLFTGPAEVVVGAVGEMVAPGARVGLVGAAEDLSPAAYRELVAALADYELVEDDAVLGAVRAVKRPRELVALERPRRIAREAVDAALAAWRDGASNGEALLVAERTARLLGSRDARVLGTIDGEALAPVDGPAGERRDRLVVYCAVESTGYWSQACAEIGAGVTGAGPARRAVDAMAAAAAPGVTAGAVAEAALAQLPGGAQDVALAYGLGGGIGLDLAERPALVPGSTEPIVAGAVLGLHAFTLHDGRLTCAGETIRVGREGAATL